MTLTIPTDNKQQTLNKYRSNSGCRVHGSRLTSMQYAWLPQHRRSRRVCGKNRMNSSVIFKLKPNALYWGFGSILSL